MYSELDIANGMTTQRTNHLVAVLPRSLMAIRVNEVALRRAVLWWSYGGRYAIGQRVASASLCAPVCDTRMVVVQLAGSFKLFGVGLPRRSTMTLWPRGIMGGARCCHCPCFAPGKNYLPFSNLG